MSPTRPAIDIAAVAARTMLCTLSTSAWRATRIHKKETKATQEKHHSSAPRVLVTVCEHKALTELACVHAQAYGEHRRLTLPTVQDGMRLLPAARHLEHADNMRRYREKHDSIVGAFLSDYEAEAAAAPARLNGLYDAAMWPSLRNVAERFGFGSRYLACPTEGAWGEWLAESARAATTAASILSMLGGVQ